MGMSMPCFSPLEAWVLPERRANGKRAIYFSYDPLKSPTHEKIKLPCSRCDGCLMDRSSQWAIRCVHESRLYEDNCFITLTFSDRYLPADRSLDVSYFQKFMKKLRKKYVPKNPFPNNPYLCDPADRQAWIDKHCIRYFHCGEYGSLRGRPHYHALLFNFDFPDKYLWKYSKQGFPVWRSPSLEQLWPWGFSEIGSVTFQSAAYVARYILDKSFDEINDDGYYERFDPRTGEVFQLAPEYVTMSRRPGIAKRWFDKYSSDVYSGDFVLFDGRKMRPPKYYDGLYELNDPLAMEEVKLGRLQESVKYAMDNTPERLAVRHALLRNRMTLLQRSIE